MPSVTSSTCRCSGLDQGEEVAAGNYEPTGPRYTFRIAAVIRMPIDIAVDEVQSIGMSASASANGMAVSHEFYEAHRDEFLDFGADYDIQLSGGERARDDFVATVEALARERGESAFFAPPRFQDRRASLESPVELETNALLLLGVGVALAGTVTIALLLRVEQRSHEHDEPHVAVARMHIPAAGGDGDAPHGACRDRRRPRCHRPGRRAVVALPGRDRSAARARPWRRCRRRGRRSGRRRCRCS